jgi:hypothetical protein
MWFAMSLFDIPWRKLAKISLSRLVSVLLPTARNGNLGAVSSECISRWNTSQHRIYLPTYDQRSQIAATIDLQ